MKKTPINISGAKNKGIAGVEKQVADLKAELNEYHARWKRALADYQNLEKRERENKLNIIKFAAKSFITKLLPVIDTLEKLNLHIKDQGLELALKELHKILKEEGVEKINCKNKHFDINSMEAVAVVSGNEDNQVVSEARAGYLMHGAVLRAARVVVSKKMSNT